MAGLDHTRASDFIGMLSDNSSATKNRSDPVLLCNETIKSLQMISDALLLGDRDMPISHQSLSGCCDTLIAKSKAVSITVTDIVDALSHGNTKKLCQLLAILAESVAITIETVAQTVYLVAVNTPDGDKGRTGVIDYYVLARAQLAISLALDEFGNNDTSVSETMSIAAVIATHLEVLREQCFKAAESFVSSNPPLCNHFKAIARSLSGSAGVVVCAIKMFVANPSSEQRALCRMFSRPFTATVDTLLNFAKNDQSFKGVAPIPSPEIAAHLRPVQAAALSLVSASTLLVGSARSLLSSSTDPANLVLVKKYAVVVENALQQLSTKVRSIRSARLIPMDS